MRLSKDYCNSPCLQVFNIAGHLIYWGDAIVIFPLSETNMYAIAPNVPTERNNKFAKKFEKRFPGQKLLEVIIYSFFSEYFDLIILISLHIIF